ncbi:(2Fe-2S)-binding protein [bacterium]|nr:(2Fe-2S)-binding protein [bacterium]
MVVCLCQGVSEKHVRRAIADGASTRREVTRACGAGGACGGCHSTIAEMICEGRDDLPGCPGRAAESEPAPTFA